MAMDREFDVSQEQPRSKEEIDSELLTAYLDGELPDADCIAVEKRLSQDPEFHAQMQELQSAWDMLDSLPLVRPNSQFVNTTVEMAIATDHLRKPKVPNAFKWLLLLIAIPLMFFVIGYSLRRESIEQPERELVSELPLIENFERYEKVFIDDPQEGIQFLQAINSRGLLAEVDDLFSAPSRDDKPVEIDTTAEPPSEDMIKDRSERITQMTQQQQEELFRKREKFELLTPERQETLREFHELLSAHPDRNKLAEALSSYFDWLKIINMNRRATLSDLDLKSRLDEIALITNEQTQQFFGAIGSTKLPEQDAVYFYRWYVESIRIYRYEIRQRVGEVLMNLREEEGLSVQGGVIERIRSGPIERLVDFLIRNSFEDREFIGNLLCQNQDGQSLGLDFLTKIVSDETRAIIDSSQLNETERQELVLKWIETAKQARFPINSADLKSFYRELPEETKNELNNMDPVQWHDELSRMYWNENIGERTAPAEDEAFENLLQQSEWWNVFDSSAGS